MGTTVHPLPRPMPPGGTWLPAIIVDGSAGLASLRLHRKSNPDWALVSLMYRKELISAELRATAQTRTFAISPMKPAAGQEAKPRPRLEPAGIELGNCNWSAVITPSLKNRT